MVGAGVGQHSTVRSISSDSPPTCPECDQPVRFGEFALCQREDDGKHVCRSVVRTGVRAGGRLRPER